MDLRAIREWKAKWIKIWIEEETKKQKNTIIIRFRKYSEWVIEDMNNIPVCPYHYHYQCILDKSMKDLENWNHLI